MDPTQTNHYMDKKNPIVQWNCNSFSNKPQEISLLCHNYNPSILCLQETRTQIKLKGYTPYNKQGTQDRQGRSHGGVGILVKNNLIHSIVPLNTTLQAIAIQVTLHKTITVCNIYIPPSSDRQAYPKIEDFEHVVSQLPKPYILLGDFNAHNRLWGSLNNNNEGQVIEELIDKQNLCLLNDGQPTFYSAAAGSKTHIDLTMCTPSIFTDFSWEVTNDTQDSDHFPILISSNSHNPDVPQKWKLYKADWIAFKEQCSQELTLEKHANEGHPIESFTSMLQTIAGNTVPKTSGNGQKPHKPWFNEDCAKAREERIEAWKRYEKNMTPENLVAFKLAKAKARRTFRQSMRSTWRDYVASLDDRAPIHKVWNMVGKMKGRESSTVKHLTKDGRKITEVKDIANCIGETLQSTSSREGGREKFQQHRRQEEKRPIDFGNNTDDNYNTNFSMAELDNALRNSNNSSPGPDNIPYEFLRQLPKTSKHCLLELYNQIWGTGAFPPSWKEATVLPFPKPGKDLSDPKNYRPIALTSCICKIFERMVNERLMWYLESKGKLRKEQCGFRRGRSTLDALSALESEVRQAFVNGEQVTAVFFDLEKAYDTAWPHGILQDLKEVGLKGQLPNFIRNYLSNRRFNVRLNNTVSDTYDQEDGVPQGGILSVTLFLLKINKIISTLPTNIGRTLYADDLLIYARGRMTNSVQRHLRLALKKITILGDQNGFRFSQAKTTCMQFWYYTRPEGEPELELYGTPIPVVENTKFLGLILDRKFNFDDHMRYLKKKCKSAMNLLKVVSHRSWGGGTETLLKLYRSLIRSQLDYGLCIYGAAYGSYLKIAQTIQNQALRLCLGAFRTTPVENLYVEAGELPLHLRQEKLTLDYAIRIAGDQSNPITTLIRTPVPNVQNYEKKDNYIRPLRMRVQAALQNAGIQLDNIAGIVPPKLPPWTIHEPEINMSLTSMKKAVTSSTNYQAAFLELMDKYRGYKAIYTDGSHLNNRTAAAAIYGNHTYSERLPDEASIYSAEQHALYLAQDHIETSDAKDFIVWSDSKSSLTAMERKKWRQPLVQKLLIRHHELTEQGKNIKYGWVPGHVGIRGNDLVDTAAKNGTNLQPNQEVHIPSLDLKGKVNVYIKRKWQVEWDSDPNNHLYSVQPVVYEHNRSNLKTRKEQVKYSRLRMGCTKLTHVYLITKENPPLCTRCQDPLTVKHILLDCQQCPIRGQYHNCRTMKDLFDTCKPETILDYVRNLGLYDDI